MLKAWTAAALIAMAGAPRAAEVIDIRVGYWEAVWSIPGEPTTREFICLTAEQLESMRFFARTPQGCPTSPVAQSRRRLEATSVCLEDGERMTIRWVLQAPDPLRFDVRASYEFGGKTQSASGAYRWLQESCSVSSPPSS